MKTKYKKFFIIEKQADKKTGNTEHMYFRSIDGRAEWPDRASARKALNSMYQLHEKQRANCVDHIGKPYATHVHKTDDTYSYDGGWETRYFYKIIEL